MKKLLVFVVLAFAASATSFAQDLITRKNGEDIKAKVLEITPYEVKYRLFDEPDGVIYTERKSDLLVIRYESGRNEVFNTNSYSDLYLTDRVPVDGIAPGMKYKHLKALYNYREFTPTLADRYSPAWSGVASFFIPGLGQMICGEVGRGFAWLGGSVSCTIIAGVSNGFALCGSAGGAATCLVASLGVLAIDICAIVDGVRVAKVKNMYEQDLRKLYTLDFNLYPSVNYIQTAYGAQPTAGMTLALKF
jgi:hypothetical protein